MPETLGEAVEIAAHSELVLPNAPIAGRTLPLWEEVKALAVRAHAAFDDRAIVGWDIAILPDGPAVVEGNGSPDMDLMQRFMDRGFCKHRFAELLTHHLRQRGYVTQAASRISSRLRISTNAPVARPSSRPCGTGRA